MLLPHAGSLLMLLPHAEVPVQVREGLVGELGLGLGFHLVQLVVQVHVLGRGLDPGRGPGLEPQVGPGLALSAVGVREGDDLRQPRRLPTAAGAALLVGAVLVRPGRRALRLGGQCLYIHIYIYIYIYVYI